MWKGFRAALSTDINYTQGIFGDVYTKVGFQTPLNDTTNHYDASNARWTPVQTGETPRYVILGAQVRAKGGVRPTLPNTNCKILRNGVAPDGGAGHYIANMPASNTNGPVANRLGEACMQTTLGILANPGDYFECWTMISAWQNGDPPINFGYYPGAVAIDGHYAHTFFWGIDGGP